MAMLMAARPRPKPQMQETLREPPPMATPAMGASPQDVAMRQKIARDLIAAGGDGSPVQHWLQGVNRVADGALGAFEQYRAKEDEKKGRESAQERLKQYLSGGKPDVASALALAQDPWLSEGASGILNASVAREFQPPTGDQRNYAFAQSPEGGGYKGSFSDFQTLSKTPVFQPPPGYAVAPDSAPGAPKVVRADGLPADPAAAPKPSVQKAEDEDIAAIQGVNSINAQLDGIDAQINSGDLDLGFFNNLGAKAQNLAGMSTKNSIAYATMMSTLEKMRNDSLRLNSGVQTEGDAVRAWNELVSNVNDPKVVKAQIARIKELNTRAADQRGQLINIRRQRNNMEGFDPASLALPGATATPGPLDTVPTDGGAGMPAPAPQGGPQPGMIEDGMQFIGGNPADPNSWKPVAPQGGPAGGPELAAPPGPQMAPPAAPDPYDLMDITRRRQEMQRKPNHRMLLRGG